MPVARSAPTVDRARATNSSASRKLGDPWVVVPVVPTLGMLRAALLATDCLRRGDAARDWVGLSEDDGYGPPLLHPELVEEVGREEAFRLCVAADAWSGCLAGLDEFLRVRGAEGATPFADGWLRPMIDRCPPDGWSEDREIAKEAYARICAERGPPFVFDRHLSWGPGQGTVVAPVRAASIMGLRGHQANLGCLGSAAVADAVRVEGMPWVYGASTEHRNDDDERGWILVAAMWRGAVDHLLSGDGDDRPLLEHSLAAGIRLRTILSDHAYAAYSDALRELDEPWVEATLASSTGALSIAVVDGLVDWRLDSSDGTGSSERGTRLSTRTPTGLLQALTRIMAGDGVSGTWRAAGP